MSDQLVVIVQQPQPSIVVTPPASPGTPGVEINQAQPATLVVRLPNIAGPAGGAAGATWGLMAGSPLENAALVNLLDGKTDIPVVHTFAYGDATPAVLFTIPAYKRTYTIEMNITTPFNGTAPALTIGDVSDHDRLMQADQILPSEAGLYTVVPEHIYSQATELLLYITPGEGCTAGAGTITIWTQA